MTPVSADTANPGADLSNWREAPFSAWAFHHVDQIVPTATIPAGGDVAPLPAAPRSLEGFSVTPFGGEPLDLDGFLKATSTDAMVILKAGAVVFETYANGNDGATPHILMSATKAVTGLLAGVLRESGELDVDAPVSRYVPEIVHTAYEGATVRNLLDMRTGVVPEGAALDAYEAASHWDPVPDEAARPSFHDVFRTLDVPHKPHGGPFRYISANTDLLGWAIERAGGKPYGQLLSERLWRPMGAETDAYITTDKAGSPRCTGGLCATVRDFARLGQLVLEGGARNGHAVVPAAWIEDIVGGGGASAWREGEWGQVFTPIGKEMRYRAGWYIVDDDPKPLFAMGIHGQTLFIDRAAGLVIAKQSSQAERFDYRAVLTTHRAVTKLRQLLG